MARNKKNKKAKEPKPPEAQNPIEKKARSPTVKFETSDTAVQDTAAVAKPPAVDNKSTDLFMATPAVTVVESSSDSAISHNESVSTTASQNIFEDDAVDVGFPPTPDKRPGKEPGVSDGPAVEGSPGWDFSHLKKDEISEAGSPGKLVVENPKEKAPIEHGFFAEPSEHEVNDKISDGPNAKTTVRKADNSTDVKASLYPWGIAGAPPLEESKKARIEWSSKDDWDKVFGTASDGPQGGESAANGGAGGRDPASGGAPQSPGRMSQTTTHKATPGLDSAQIIMEQEIAIHECEVILQNCTDELDASEKERAQLEIERDQFKRELSEAHETLQTIHEKRQKLQDEKNKHKLREADWDVERERLEARIEQLNKGAPPGGGGGGPLEGTSFDDSGGSPTPSDGTGTADLKSGILKLKDELQTMRAALEKAQDERNTLRSYRNTQEDHKLFRARIASCKTEKEKLEQYGGTVDRTSRLYWTLKKLAGFLDNGELEPAADEYAQIKTFHDCLAERRRIMAQAKAHPDPREFVTPYLDKWDQVASIGGWGATLTARIAATRMALDKFKPQE